FQDSAEEAVKFYVSLFPNSKIVNIQKVEKDGGPIPKGKVLGADFILDGREYLAFDGGPSFNFTEGISLMVMCKTQEEVDRYWSKLTQNGGEEGPCRWIKDRDGNGPGRVHGQGRHADHDRAPVDVYGDRPAAPARVARHGRLHP